MRTSCPKAAPHSGRRKRNRRCRPSPFVAARLDVLEEADDLVALVLLEVLVGDDRVGWRLGAGVDPVKDLWLLVQVEAEALKMVVPVRELYDHLDLGIHVLCRLHDQVGARLIHELQPEVRPRLGALRSDVGIGLRVVEEEIVQDELVEMPRRQLGGLLHEFAVGGVRGDGIDGFIVPPRDAEALADRIEMIVTDRCLRDEMSKNARKRAEDFTWTRYGERLLSSISTTMAHGAAETHV